MESFRREIPDITILTDVITGHPGETEEDHQRTIELINDIKPDEVNLSKFGARPGTHASKLQQIPKDIVNRRSRELAEIIKETSIQKNKKWLGWKGSVLIDEKVGNAVIGRNHAYKPVVIKENLELGANANVKIVKTTRHALVGRIINP